VRLESLGVNRPRGALAVRPPNPAADVLRRLLNAPNDPPTALPRLPGLLHGRPGLRVQSSNRQGVTIRLHAGSGAGTDELVDAQRQALAHLEAEGRELKR